MRIIALCLLSLTTINCVEEKDDVGVDWPVDSGGVVADPSGDGGPADDGGSDDAGSDDAGVSTPTDTGNAEQGDTGTSGPSVPDDVDGDGFTVADGDCDDASTEVYPGAPERCDATDNDCDEEIDEEAIDATEWFRDSDGDGLGDPDVSTVACEPEEGWVSDASDCNDTDGTTDGCPRCMSGRLDGERSDIQADDDVAWAFGTSDFSIGIWLRFNSMAGTHQPLVTQNQTDAFEAWTMYLYDDDLYFGRRLEGIGTPWAEVYAEWTPTLGSWHHVVVTRTDTSSFRFFVDGALIGASERFMAVPNFDGPLKVGAGVLTPDGIITHSHMDVDALHIWSKALSETEILAHFTAHPTGDEEGLKAYWNYAEGSGETAADLSGNGHTATLSSAEWLPECSLL